MHPFWNLMLFRYLDPPVEYYCWALLSYSVPALRSLNFPHGLYHCYFAYQVMKTDPDQRVLNKAITWRRSVVLILRTRIHRGKTSYSNGSGFIIKASGADCQVITNRHVVEDDGIPFNTATDKIFVRVMCEPDGVEELPGSIRFIHPLVDLALIEVRGMTEQMPRPLRFTSAHEEPIGATAIAIGYCNPRSIGNKRLLVRTPSVCPGSKV